MASPALTSVHAAFLERYGPEKGSALFDHLAGRCGNDPPLIHAVFQAAAPFLEGTRPEDLLAGLNEAFASGLFAAFLSRERTDARILTAVLAHSFALRAALPRARPLSPVPLRTIYHHSPVKLAELDRKLNAEIKEAVHGEPRAPAAVFFALADLFFAGVSDLTRISLLLAALSRRVTGDDEERTFLPLLEKLLLSFAVMRGVHAPVLFGLLDKAFAAGFPSKDLLLVLFDFHLDNRYTPRHFKPLFSLLVTCITAFHPKGKTALIPAVLRLLKDFIRISNSAASHHAKTIFRLFVGNPNIDLTDWVIEGARMIRKHGDSPAADAFFSRESDASRRIWEEIDSGIVFSKTAARLQFFINAVTGKPVVLKSNASRPLSEGAHLYYTDGDAVYVPAYVNYGKNRDVNYMVLLHSVAHECAHIEFGSFLEDRARFTDTARTLRLLFPGQYDRNLEAFRRFLDRTARKLSEMGYPVAGSRVNPDGFPLQTRLFFHVEFPFILRDLQNIIEDSRVDRLMYKAYPGFRREKADVDRIDFEAVPDVGRLPPVEALMAAFAELVRFDKIKGEPPAAVVPYLGRMREILGRFRALESPDVYHCIEKAAYLYQVLMECMRNLAPRLLEKARRQGSKDDVDLGFLGNSIGDGRNAPLQIEMAWARRTAIKRGEQVSEDDERMRAKREALEKALDENDVTFFDRRRRAGQRIYLYPEWNQATQCYQEDRCALVEIPFQDGTGPTDNLRSRFRGSLENVKRAFLRMKPQAFADLRGMDDGHEIDFDRYVDALMDLAGGHGSDGTFYTFRERRQRSVLCALVLDMSPSTSLVVGDGSIFLHQKYAAYLLAEAIHSIGDPFGIFSFYDFGPPATLFQTLKGFDEQYGELEFQRLCGFHPAKRGFSRFAVGLRHITAKIKDREEKSKIIFFITDGLPGYFEEAVDRHEMSTEYTVDGRTVKVDRPVPVLSSEWKSDLYASHDLRKVYEEAAIAGINLFCITLDGDSVEFMAGVFGNSLVYLPDVTQLPHRLVEIFKKVTT